MRLQELGYEIRRVRLERGLTQAMLAKDAGVTRTTLNQLENGLSPNLGFKKIQAILERLSLTLSVQPLEMRPDSIKMSATTSSVSYRAPLTADELVRALISGRIPRGKRPHFRTLLDEGPSALLLSLVREARRWTRAGRIEKNLAKIAHEVGATKKVEDWLKIG